VLGRSNEKKKDGGGNEPSGDKLKKKWALFKRGKLIDYIP